MTEAKDTVNVRWTRHPRGLAEDSNYGGVSIVRDGQMTYVAQPGEQVATHIYYQDDSYRQYEQELLVRPSHAPRRVKENEVRIDRSEGRGQIIDIVYLRPEVTGWRLNLAKALDRFDQSRIGKWWSSGPSF